MQVPMAAQLRDSSFVAQGDRDWWIVLQYHGIAILQNIYCFEARGDLQFEIEPLLGHTGTCTSYLGSTK
jgi:hypothetical protein